LEFRRQLNLEASTLLYRNRLGSENFDRESSALVSAMAFRWDSRQRWHQRSNSMRPDIGEHQLLCASLLIAFLVREPTPQTTRADRPAFCRFAQEFSAKVSKDRATPQRAIWPRSMQFER
jgi:hypothetical protein